jgi:hypothetical protein
MMMNFLSQAFGGTGVLSAKKLWAVEYQPTGRVARMVVVFYEEELAQQFFDNCDGVDQVFFATECLWRTHTPGRKPRPAKGVRRGRGTMAVKESAGEEDDHDPT